MSAIMKKYIESTLTTTIATANPFSSLADIETSEVPAGSSAVEYMVPTTGSNFTGPITRTKRNEIKFSVWSSPIEQKREMLNEKKEQRQNAKEAITNMSPTETRQYLARTKLCNSVTGKGHCHGVDRCNFAHTVAELNIAPCKYDQMTGECRLVQRPHNGPWRNRFNKKGAVCKFLHAGETKEEFWDRTGKPAITVERSIGTSVQPAEQAVSPAAHMPQAAESMPQAAERMPQAAERMPQAAERMMKREEGVYIELHAADAALAYDLFLAALQRGEKFVAIKIV